MNTTTDIYQAIFNTAPEHIAVVDHSGTIQSVNTAWCQFGLHNGLNDANKHTAQNYLEVCDKSAKSGDKDAAVVTEKIRRCLSNQTANLHHVYPCHSETERRWFRMSMRPLQWDGTSSYIISHYNITPDVLLREKLLQQTHTDSLTGLGNRRYYDKQLKREWRRNMRTGSPLSLVMIDIDQFKSFNDQYGHVSGDDCLRQVAKTIQSVARRPGDHATRYGGEEFALILGSTSAVAAYSIAELLLLSIRKLNISHKASSVDTVITASVGVATTIPEQGANEIIITHQADQALYSAKKSGRDTVISYGPASAP